MEMAVMETQFMVIIPYYNCKEWIVKCVESILSQTYQNFHILLIDDASTDGGNAIALEKYWTHPKISCGKNLSNCGALYNISMEVKHDSIKNEDVIEPLRIQVQLLLFLFVTILIVVVRQNVLLSTSQLP